MIAEEESGSDGQTSEAANKYLDLDLTEYPSRRQSNSLRSFYIEHLYQYERAADLLAEYGVQHDPIQHGYFGGAKVRLAGPFFEQDDDGDFAVIVPVWAGSVPSISRPVDNPLLVDCIAFHPSKPERWWALRGEHGCVLGEQALFDAACFGEPLLLRSTPLSWLRHGCTGTVLIDRHGLRRLHGLKTVVAENIEQGVALDRALKNSVRLPAIKVLREAVHA